MEFSPDAKRAFHVQTYGAASTIDGVRVVELARHADDGASRLLGVPPGVAHGVRNLGEAPGGIVSLPALPFSPEPVTCDEGRLPGDFAGKDVWEIARG